ncbi:PREDICTED: uncharacterized protein LOC101304304 isoform 2 [Fragaria vesca subsp. vesca]|uniref:uncharacterized protein LOC101304304 n=1 Tax=Fragaria vesca subsp. vesca TaxID=101020 RepID=UPI0002C2FF26|nr:PREDICTED: uncharacterized protein LOC101304304 [Fragaria vesca subsp. vesca]
MTQEPHPHNPNSNSEFETLILEPPPHPEMKPPQEDNPDSLPVRSPRSRTALTFSRKKRKKTGRNPKATKKNLEILRKTLNPIPFVPAKTLDFDAHEDLLKRLGLWDFVHIKFDRSIRADLLSQLIVNYNPQLRCSYVHELRFHVNRSDLGRALKLPVNLKNKKNAAADAGEEQPPATEEAIAFLEDLVSNWLLLHEDTWMMPSEVVNFTKPIKEGQFGKVDWAGLIWFMVNEEIGMAPQLEKCYYASHLQQLIKSQREDLFSVKQESKVPIDLKDDDDEEEDAEGGRLEELEVKLCLRQENAPDVDVERGNSERVDVEQVNVESVDVEGEDVEKVDVGKENVDRDDAGKEKVEKVEAEQENVDKVDAEQENVGKVDVEQENAEKVDAEQDNAEKVSCETERVEDGDVMDFEEFKEAEPAQWVLAGKENLGEPCLQRCNLGGVKEFGCGDERNQHMELGEGVGEEEQEEDAIEEEEEEDDDDQEGGFHLLPKGFSLEGFPSGNLTQGMDGMPLRDHFGLEFPSPRDIMLPGSSSLYGNGPKREISHENDNSHHGLNGNKRLRTDGSWDSKMSGDFETGMDQIQQWIGGVADVQQWMGKARMMYAAKESECQQASVNQQILMQELQKRDELIEHLHKARFDEQQKLQTEKFRFEHEAHLMKNLLEGYRKALKETQKAFAEYRVHYPHAVEPLYRDVPGSGGLVLSTTELEKLHTKQEEEERMKRLAIETMIKDFEGKWIRHYETHHKNVEIFIGRLMDAQKEVNSLKEGISKQRGPETQGSDPNES